MSFDVWTYLWNQYMNMEEHVGKSDNITLVLFLIFILTIYIHVCVFVCVCVSVCVCVWQLWNSDWYVNRNDQIMFFYFKE